MEKWSKTHEWNGKEETYTHIQIATFIALICTFMSFKNINWYLNFVNLSIIIT